jgi:AhpC/TSA family
MLTGVLLVIVAQTPAAAAPAELTGVLDSRLTAPTPSATVTCTGATKADRLLLPDDAARARRVWSCTLQCVAPIGKRHALLIERRWRQPVLLLDDNADGRFDAREKHEFPRPGDLQIRVPVTSALYTDYPIAIRYSSQQFKPRSSPARRTLLESSMAHVGGTVTIGGQQLRVEYPVWTGMTPVLSGGWFRIDANGDGRIDDDPLSEESAPPALTAPIVRVGNRYVSTVSIDVDTRTVKLRQHPPEDYQRVVLRVGEPLADFTYRDITTGAPSALSDLDSRLVLLVVWSSWCQPALEELPRVEAVFRTFASEGLAVLGLPDEWERKGAEPVVSRFRLTWPNADPESIRELLKDRWQVAAVPQFILLDADRRILRISRAGDESLRGANLRRTIQLMLRAPRR